MPVSGYVLCVSHRGLQASVGHVAADRYILAVFAGVKRHWPVVTLCKGLLPACALHTVHVDGTGTYRGRAWSDSSHRFTCVLPTIGHMQNDRLTHTHSHTVHKRLLRPDGSAATDVHRVGLKAQT